jgi:hypothetical protein
MVDSIDSPKPAPSLLSAARIIGPASDDRPPRDFEGPWQLHAVA